MPFAPKKPCNVCRRLDCTDITHTRKAYDQHRGGSTARLYDYRWQQARKRFIRTHPKCKPCQDDGRVTATFAVDHRIPHRGDSVLFWDQSNWQPMCKPHHDAKSARERLSGYGGDV